MVPSRAILLQCYKSEIYVLYHWPKNASTNFIWCAISKRLVTVFYGPKGKGAAIAELKSGKKSRCTVLFPFFSVILQVTSHDALGRTLLSEIANFET